MGSMQARTAMFLYDVYASTACPPAVIVSDATTPASGPYLCVCITCRPRLDSIAGVG